MSLTDDELTEQQRTTKITNLVKRLRRRGVVVNRGTRPKPQRELTCASAEGAQFWPTRRKGDDTGGTARGPGSA